MNQNNAFNEEIDLKKLFLKFWFGKIYIIFFLFLFLGSLWLQYAERKYTVEYKLKPVNETKQNNSLAKLGGFASITGIQLPSNSSTDFMIFKELITSVEVSEIIFENKELIKNLYSSEWNAVDNNFSEPKRNQIKVLFSSVKNILTGNNNLNYVPPNAKRLATFISDNIQISDNKDTGFISIKTKTSEPNMMLLLILESTEASDKIMRQRYVEFSTEPLAFYKEKLRTARSREHREALAELISAEEQKLMLASRGKHFTAEPYINPTISLYPTEPKPKIVLLISMLLGLLTGATVILIRFAIMKDNK